MELPPRTHKKKIIDQHNRCYYCGFELLGKIDHILPFSKHKDGTVKNLCLTCVDCNRYKTDMEMHEFKAKVVLNRPYKLIRGMFYFEFLGL